MKRDKAPSMYKTTIRFSHPKHIEMINRVKNEYYSTSLSKALIMAIRELYELKEDMAMIKKAIKPTLEIDVKVLQKLF